MKKENFDLFSLVFLLSIFNILYSFIPIVLLTYFWLFHPERYLLNGFVTFISFFIIIDIRPWFIEWHNYWITFIISSYFGSFLSFFIPTIKTKKSFRRNFLKLVTKKMPTANFSLFLLDTLIHSFMLSIVFGFIPQKIRFGTMWQRLSFVLITLLLMFISIYISLVKSGNKKRG